MSDETASGNVIRIKSLFFAAYRDLVGAAELELELPHGVTVRELVRAVRARPGAVRIPDSPVVAVNREYSELDRVLCDGDEVAFIPPVAGG